MTDRFRPVPSARLARLAAFGQLAGGAEVELSPGTDACADCGGRLRRIGEDGEAITASRLQLPRRPEGQATGRARAIYMRIFGCRALHLRDARALNAEMKRLARRLRKEPCRRPTGTTN